MDGPGTDSLCATGAGAPATLAEAAAAAARLLAAARRPLIGGLGTDVQGARAACRLADRTGAVVVGEIPEFAIAVGTPAKVVRDRRAEGAS